MKKEWSGRWSSSVQPRKQRKFRANAPLHVLRRFISSSLSPALRERYKRRSMPVRTGDEVRVMRGSKKNLKGLVERVDLKAGKIYIDSMKTKKTDGSEIHTPIDPSNIQITVLNLDDKMRLKSVAKAEKEAEKQGKS